MKLRVGIDIDGVLYPWDVAARDALVAQFGCERPGESTSWDYLKTTLPPEQWRWLWSGKGQDAAFGRLDLVYPGVVDAVNAILKQGHDVHFVTHRDPRRTACHTAAFLTTHFGRHPWAGLHVIRSAMRKVFLAGGYWDVFVDDNPTTVMDFLDMTSAQVFAPARPWNAELQDHWRLTRYTNPEVLVEWLT